MGKEEDVFGTLFGIGKGSGDSLPALFSDSNPYKRKAGPIAHSPPSVSLPAEVPDGNPRGKKTIKNPKRRAALENGLKVAEEGARAGVEKRNERVVEEGNGRKKSGKKQRESSKLVREGTESGAPPAKKLKSGHEQQVGGKSKGDSNAGKSGDVLAFSEKKISKHKVVKGSSRHTLKSRGMEENGTSGTLEKESGTGASELKHRSAKDRDVQGAAIAAALLRIKGLKSSGGKAREPMIGSEAPESDLGSSDEDDEDVNDKEGDLHFTEQDMLEEEEGGEEEEEEEGVGEEERGKRGGPEGVREADSLERLVRTVFVGNLPKDVKKKAVAKEFGQFGGVESVRVRSVPLAETKLSRKAGVITGKLLETRHTCNAYVVFKDTSSATAALAHNTAQFSGRHLRVDRASAPRSAPGGSSRVVEYDRGRSVFVGSLPMDVEEEELHACFGGPKAPLPCRGAVEAVRAVRDPSTNLGKGIAFVLFRTKAAAQAALAVKEQKLRERVIRVSRPTKMADRKGEKPTWGENAAAGRGLDGTGNKAEEGAGKKREPMPYEGMRALNPGKGAGAKVVRKQGGEGGGAGKEGKKGGGDKEGKVRLTKRPSVAARKLAANGGLVGRGGGAAGGRGRGMGGGRGRGGGGGRGRGSR